MFVLRGSHYVVQFMFKLTAILVPQLLNADIIRKDHWSGFAFLFFLFFSHLLFSRCFKLFIPNLQLVMMNESVSINLRSIALRANAICALLPSGVQMKMFQTLNDPFYILWLRDTTCYSGLECICSNQQGVI